MRLTVSESDKGAAQVAWGECVVLVDGRVIEPHQYTYNRDTGTVTIHRVPFDAAVDVHVNMVLTAMIITAARPLQPRKSAQWKQERRGRSSRGRL